MHEDKLKEIGLKARNTYLDMDKKFKIKLKNFINEIMK